MFHACSVLISPQSKIAGLIHCSESVVTIVVPYAVVVSDVVVESVVAKDLTDLLQASSTSSPLVAALTSLTSRASTPIVGR